jgi:exosortase/archaeosortase family protein
MKTKIQLRDIRLSRQHGSMLLTAATLVALSPLTFRLDAFRQVVFCFPAAQLSAIFLGAPCVPVGEGYLIERASLPILVSLACSGTGFFVLLTALLLGLLCRYRKLSLPLAFGTIVAAYGIALMTNVCRITLGFFASVGARCVLPECMWAGIHLSVGVLVFLSALVGVYICIERRLSHE